MLNANKLPRGRLSSATVLQDFNEPSPGSVRRILSSLVNFAKFCEWKEPDVVAAELQVCELLQDNQEQLERIEVLRREYDIACSAQEDKELVRRV